MLSLVAATRLASIYGLDKHFLFRSVCCKDCSRKEKAVLFLLFENKTCRRRPKPPPSP